MTASESEEWAALIAHHPMFEAMSGEDFAYLLSDEVSRKHRLDKGETILKQDSVGDSLFVICEGSVSVMLERSKGDSIELHRAGKGEVLGEMALFGHRMRAATLVTAEPCKLLEIKGDEFRTLMRKHSDMALYLLAKLSQRLRHTDDLILSREISGIDGSLGELGTRLDVITQTTDAKLTAAQALFDQTNRRTAELIHSAERRQSALKYLGAAAVTVLGLTGFASYKSFTDVVDNTKAELAEIKSDALDTRNEIADLAEGIDRNVAEVGTRVAEVAKHAEEASKAAGAAQVSAGDAESNAVLAFNNAKTSSDATIQAMANAARINRLVEQLDETDTELNEAYYSFILTLLKFRVGDELRAGDFSDTTREYYIDCVTADIPSLRSDLITFLHDEIASRGSETRRAYLNVIFGEALNSERINFVSDRRPEVITNYFMALAYLLEGDRRSVLDRIDRIRVLLEGVNKTDYYREFFGEDYAPEDVVEILLLDQDGVVEWQRRALATILTILQG